MRWNVDSMPVRKQLNQTRWRQAQLRKQFRYWPLFTRAILLTHVEQAVRKQFVVDLGITPALQWRINEPSIIVALEQLDPDC